MEADEYQVFPNGHSKFAYVDACAEGKKHASGWAMRNTNNHNVNILKKSCLGVLVCNRNCSTEAGEKVHLRPAICDKARKKQLGKFAFIICPSPVILSDKINMYKSNNQIAYKKLVPPDGLVVYL